MEIRPGTQLGHYQIVGALGAGGMGEVYRAHDLKLKRDVAIKVLPEHVSSHPETLSRFEREAVVLAQMSHPNILAIHDFGKYQGVTAAVTELLEGKTLRQRLEESPLRLREALEIGAGIAEGLAAAHSRGIIHRDLKPENVFLTSDGHMKILDFGLARAALRNGSVEGHFDETSLPTETEPGMIKGTIGYMSPEQLRGEKVDGRSDIFSLGCVLYEMFTGRRAFLKQTVADTMTAILQESPPGFFESGRTLPPEAEKLTGHCLEKAPEKRFQSALDLALHLRTLASNPDLSIAGFRGAGRRRRAFLYVAGILLLLLLPATGLFLSRFSSPSPEQSITVQGTRPSVAVLYFENNTGDPSLDWLRTALTNMLVTDLSQSPQIEVLSTDRLYQLLSEMGRLNDPAVSFEVIRQLAGKANVSTVILGSFVKAGDTYRLPARLQEAESGRILATERVQGKGESSLFEMVDEITRNVREALEVSASASYLDKGIESVTSSSVEAYRLYVEGNQLHTESRGQAAIPLLEKAVELDPDFAMALAKLSVVYWNVGQIEQTYEYAERALQHVDRLTARERYYIEGRYYSLDPETLDQAVRAYEQAIHLYPDHAAARHNLANLYMSMGRYEDAITQYRALTDAGSSFAGTYINLSKCYSETGSFSEAEEVLRDYVAEHRENGTGYRELGAFLTRRGRYDEALEELSRAEVLTPGDMEVKADQWSVYYLSDQWEEAEKLLRELDSAADPVWKFRASLLRARQMTLRGHFQAALEILRESGALVSNRGPFAAEALAERATLQLRRGHYSEALELAKEAVRLGHGFSVEARALQLSALAASGLGRSEEALAAFENLRQEYRKLPQHLVDRRDNLLLGEIALLEGNLEEAKARLKEAGRTFSSREPALETLSFEAGLVDWLLGKREEAVKWFEQCAESDRLKMEDPVAHVRSLFFLGKFHADRGDLRQARHYFRRFLGYWGDGDADRKQVAEAGQALRS